VARFIRPQFSLATLLIAMAWSGVAVWITATSSTVTACSFHEPVFVVVCQFDDLPSEL
jgi:hypothetical protein